MTTLLGETIQKARKTHACDECRKAIMPDEIYVRQTQVDGEMRIYKAHIECNQASREHRDLCDLSDDEETYGLSDELDPREDRGWILDKYPAVAARLGWLEAA